MDEYKTLLKHRNAWRGHFGDMVPSISSAESTMEFCKHVPEGITMSIATLGISKLTLEQVELALTKVDDAARRLADYGVDFIGIGGTPIVSIKGFGWDKELIARVEKIAGVPATTSMTAAVEAFRTLGVSRVVIASPMPHEFDARTKSFLEANGIKVLHIESLNIAVNAEIRSLSRFAPYIVARKAYLAAKEAEAIYIPCGSWGNAEIIDSLEKDFAKPVIHSNQVSAWAFLRALNIREPVKGWGRIFETLH